MPKNVNKILVKAPVEQRPRSVYTVDEVHDDRVDIRASVASSVSLVQSVMLEI